MKFSFDFKELLLTGGGGDPYSLVLENSNYIFSPFL